MENAAPIAVSSSDPKNLKITPLNENDTGMSIMANKRQLFQLTADTPNFEKKLRITVPMMQRNAQINAQRRANTMVKSAVVQEYGKQVISQEIQRHQEYESKEEEKRAQEAETAKEENKEMNAAEEQFEKQAQQSEKMNTQKKSTVTKRKKIGNSVVDTALMIGGGFSLALLGGTTAFTLFFG